MLSQARGRPLGPAILRSVGTVAASVTVLAPFLLAPRPHLLGLRLVTQKTTSPEAFLHFGALLVIPAIYVWLRDDGIPLQNEST